MSTDKEQARTRRKFPYLEVYWQEEQNLRRPQTREAFRRAVIEYGLYHREPDFAEEPDAELLRLAWSHVERWLVGGWTLSQKRSAAGKAGGAPAGNQNARKRPVEEEEGENKQTSKNKL